jgi:hypothetical protein
MNLHLHPRCRTVVCLGVLVAAVLICGCSRGPRVVPVSGTVTRAGKPVAKLIVTFMPTEGRPSWGLTDENGKFTLNYARDKDGALVGTHTVWVSYQAADPGEEQALQDGTASLPAELNDILQVYGKKETTPLQIEIKKAETDLQIKLD